MTRVPRSAFCWSRRFFNSILGKNEFALRLFPLLIGILSLWLFYLLLKRITNGAGLFTALALFAFNPRLVYYSSEVKQYILDVAVTISLLLIAAPDLQPSPSQKGLCLAGARWLARAVVLSPSLVRAGRDRACPCDCLPETAGRFEPAPGRRAGNSSGSWKSLFFIC